MDLEGLELFFDDRDDAFPDTLIDCTVRLPATELPPGASAADIEAAVAAAIAETGAASAKDMGKVMKAVMPKLAGKTADGRAVNEAVRRALGA